MNSRPLLDYLAFNDDFPEPFAAEPAVEPRPVDPIAARLKDLEARLRASHEPVASASKQDLTLSAQIEAILKRKVALQPMAPEAAQAQPSAFRQAASQADDRDQQHHRQARVVMNPPPSVPVSSDQPGVDQEFLKFSEAVYLIGQAAKRFMEEPQPQPRQAVTAPSATDIEALSAVLRETVSAFRSVADDLAVSAGEIRHYATRAERQQEQAYDRQPERRFERQSDRRRPLPARYRDEDEILELRENIADLQDRLDDLLQVRRRARY